MSQNENLVCYLLELSEEDSKKFSWKGYTVGEGFAVAIKLRKGPNFALSLPACPLEVSTSML